VQRQGRRLVEADGAVGEGVEQAAREPGRARPRARVDPPVDHEHVALERRPSARPRRPGEGRARGGAAQVESFLSDVDPLGVVQ